MAARDITINLRPDRQTGAFIQSYKNGSALQLSAFYREEKVSIKLYFVAPSATGGLSAPFTLQSIGSYNCRIGIGVTDGTILCAQSLDWVDDHFEGVLNINTVQMNEALDAVNGADLTRTFEVELANATEEFTFQQNVTIRNEVLTDAGSLPEDVDETLFLGLLEDTIADVFADTPEVRWDQEADDMKARAAVWRDATISADLRVETPPTTPHGNTTSQRTYTTVVTVNGHTGRLYQLDFRVRGLFGLTTYTGGTNLGLINIGGTHSHLTGNPISLTVSDPPQVLYLNRGLAASDRAARDYLLTVTAKAGATITLVHDTTDNGLDPWVSEILVPGVDPYPDEFDGWFVDLTLINANEDGMIMSDLDDGPPDTEGQGGKYLRVKADETGYEHVSAVAPAVHAASHASGGSDPVTLAQSQITNLTTDLAAKQPLDATLTALAGLSVSANTLVQGTGSDSFQMTSFAANKFPARSSSGSLAAKDITDYALTLLDDSGAATARTTLGLGSIATQAAGSVSISGGSISGITDLAVADGGTGASDAANARTNLGAASTGANTFTALQQFSGTGHAGLKLNSLTTTQRDALTPANGMLIYNTTDAKVQKYEAGAWVDVGSGSGAALELYVENPSSPSGITAVGTNSAAIGQYSAASGDDSVAIAGATANADNSVAIGTLGLSDVVGKLCFGPYVNIAYVAQGAAQAGMLVVGAQTTDATQTELLVTGPHRLTLRNTSTFAFSILLAARRTDADGENDAWEFKGLIHRDANAASTTLDALQENQIGSTSWSVAVDADTTNGSLRVRVTGQASKTIRWVATITTTEVSE